MSKQKILIIKHGALGDLIQSDGVLRDIRQHYLAANITLLTEPKYGNLMQRCPHVDQAIYDSRAAIWKINQQIGLFRQIKKERFDLVIDLQNSRRTQSYRRLLFNKVKWVGRPVREKPKSGLMGMVNILQGSGIVIKSALDPKVTWMADDVSTLLNKEGISKPYIALIPGCSALHPEKRWPYFADLAENIIKNGYDVVNILGPDELDLAGTLPGHTLIEKYGLLSWFEMAGLLNEASFVIGNDTGPSHIASCLRKPGLALFGSYSSLERAEIKRGDFGAIKVNDLSKLPVDDVLQRVLDNTS